MFKALYTTYTNCKKTCITDVKNSLKNNPLGVEKHWEKTVEALYFSFIENKTDFLAPLAYTQEAYGDMLVAYSSLQWALIEFKVNKRACAKERDKYVRTNKEKYKDSKSRPDILAEQEKIMFESFVEEMAKCQPNNQNESPSLPREPHFFIYGPDQSEQFKQITDLSASLYWGAWATEGQDWANTKLVDIQVNLRELPKWSADYENFVRYAGCVKLAKSGVFSVEEGDGGTTSGLKDLTLVVGLADESVQHVTTLETFLAVQKNAANFVPQHKPKEKLSTHLRI